MTVIRKKVVSPLGCQSCDPRSTILAIMSLLSALVEIQDTLTLSTRQYNKQVKLFFFNDHNLQVYQARPRMWY